MPRVAYRLDTGTPYDALRWVLKAAHDTGKLVTQRDARQLYGAPHDFATTVTELHQTGELRTFTKPASTPGRPTIYLHPVYLYEVDFELQDGKPRLTVHLTDDPADLHPNYAALEETDPHPATEREEAVVGSSRGSRHDVHSSSQDSKPNPEPLPDLKPTREPYELLRRAVKKSIRDRGYGPTEDELVWILERSGIQDAEGKVKELSATAKEAYLEGGLLPQYPHSPNNKTEQTRFSLRTVSQALEPYMAEFKAESARTNQSAGQPQSAHRSGAHNTLA